MSGRTLEGLPWWAKRLDELSGHFSAQGLGGLLDHHAVTNALGEALALGGVTPEELHAWVTGQVVKRMSQGPSPETIFVQDSWAAYHSDPRAFWEQCWETLLGRKIEIPAIPKLKGKTKKAIERYKLMLVFLPEITEDDYPQDFVRLEWNRFSDRSKIEYRPLPGRWVLVETIAKPSWLDVMGYQHDNLGTDLNLTTRFKIARDSLTATILPRAAKLFGLAPLAVRLPTAEEWNLVGNVFLWLNNHRNMNLPDLGSTNSYELCLNNYGPKGGIMIGLIGSGGGLGGIAFVWPNMPSDVAGFRVLAVL